MHQSSNTPNVAAKAVLLAACYLWSHIAGTSDYEINSVIS